MTGECILTDNTLKNNRLNVWYVVFSLYLCNTESDTKKPPASLFTDKHGGKDI